MAYTPLAMGAYHMIGNDAWEPQRNNNFEIQFPNLPQLFTPHTGIALPANASDLLTLSVKDVSGITENISAIKVSYGNNSINFAGKPDYGDVQITFHDYIGIETERILTAWSKLVYNPMDETVGRASNYKYDGYLLEFAPDGVQMRTWQLRGCFPGTLSYGGYSMDDNSIRDIACTFYVDVAIPLD